MGNGGGAWICEDRAGHIRWMEFVDPFEAAKEFGYKLQNTADESLWEILKNRIELIFTLSPTLCKAMESHPVDISKVIRFLPETSRLNLIEDALIRVRPSPNSCQLGYLYYGQSTNFTSDGRLLIDTKY